MRPVDAAREEERVVVRALELLADPFRQEPVATELLVRHVERGPVGFVILPFASARQIHGALGRIERARERIVLRFVREVIIPRLRVDHVVEHLARAGGPVAIPRKVARHQLRIRQHLAHLLPVVVKPRAMRRQLAQDRRTRRIARRPDAIGVLEQHAARREPIKVWRLRLRMPAKASDPIIEIAHRISESLRGRTARPDQCLRLPVRETSRGIWKPEPRHRTPRALQDGALLRLASVLPIGPAQGVAYDPCSRGQVDDAIAVGKCIKRFLNRRSVVAGVIRFRPEIPHIQHASILWKSNLCSVPGDAHEVVKAAEDRQRRTQRAEEPQSDHAEGFHFSFSRNTEPPRLDA